MPKPHAPYTHEFRSRFIDLVRAGRTRESLSWEFHVSAQSIRNWVRQAGVDAGRRSDGLTLGHGHLEGRELTGPASPSPARKRRPRPDGRGSGR